MQFLQAKPTATIQQNIILVVNILDYIISVPYGLTAEEFYAWYYHGGGHDLHSELGKIFNMKSFIAGNTGLQPGGWYNKEINSADDFNGLKFRMPGGEKTR